MYVICDVCGMDQSWLHDHKPDQSGLDDGPPLPGHAPRKKMTPKPADEVRNIRARAWATRREKYGRYGHK